MTIVLLFVALALLVWRGCSWRAELLSYQKKISNLGLREQTFKEKIEEDGTRIAEQEELILTQKQAIQNDLIRIVELRKIKSQVNVKTITKIDSVFIPFDETWQDENFWDDDDLVYVNDSTFLVQIDYSTLVNIDTLREQYRKKPEVIYVPKTFSLVDDYYSLSGNVKKTGVFIDSLRLFNDLTISTGLQSQGIFKRPKPMVIVDYQNPYVSTRNLSNITIKDKLKWYDRKGFWFGLGLLGGVTTTYFITK